MNNKKLISCVLTGVLSFGIVGGLGASTFANTALENKKAKQPADYVTNALSQENIQKIRDELKALGPTAPDQVDKEEYLSRLDAATKEKLEAIAEKLKTQKLTSEEALELRKQRINLPKQEKANDNFTNIDAETRAKAKEILDKVMVGTMTKDEAISELGKLGVPLPNLEELRSMLDHSDAETRAKVEAINKKVKEGTITKEESSLEIRKLRIKPSSLGEQGK
jgi:hypothetical protein